MFTGIIEDLGLVKKIEKKGTNLELIIESNITKELKIDQSLSHNGVCLTIEKITDKEYQVTAIKETLDKSNLKNLVVGEVINLERCLRIGDRLDGHMVQGHVDQLGQIDSIVNESGSYLINVKHKQILGNTTVEKGSITLNGISLTAFNSKHDGFSVAIIPYTWENTNMMYLKVNDYVNLEFDILGKYAMKIADLKK